jgi:hypothetical protein
VSSPAANHLTGQVIEMEVKGGKHEHVFDDPDRGA